MGQFRKGMLKDEESVALSVSLFSSKVSFHVSTSGTLAGNFVAPVLRLLWTERHKPFINFNDDRSVVVVETVLAAKAVAAFQGTSCPFRSLGSATQGPACPVFRQREGRFFNVCCQRVSGGGPVASRWHGWSGCVCHDEWEDIGLTFHTMSLRNH